VLAHTFRTPQARALFLGCAAHLFPPLTRPLSSSVGAMMIAAGHRFGWPVAQGAPTPSPKALASLL
jgi:phytoene dehydrogenase-like protein